LSSSRYSSLIEDERLSVSLLEIIIREIISGFEIGTQLADNGKQPCYDFPDDDFQQ
jgi:hypothetical protein